MRIATNRELLRLREIEMSTRHDFEFFNSLYDFGDVDNFDTVEKAKTVEERNVSCFLTIVRIVSVLIIVFILIQNNFVLI